MSRDTVIRGSDLVVRITDERIEDLFKEFPHVTWKHVRDGLVWIFNSFRKRWLERTDVNFKNKESILAKRNARSERPGIFHSDKAFYFGIWPRTRTVPKGQTPDLGDISAEIYTRSEASLGLELGEEHHALGGRFMAIPIAFALNKNGKPKAGFSSVKALQKSTRLKNKELVPFTHPAKRSRPPILYLVQRGRSKKSKVRLRPVFQLVRKIDRKPRLKMMDVWASLDKDRGLKLETVAGRIMDEVDGR